MHKLSFRVRLLIWILLGIVFGIIVGLAFDNVFFFMLLGTIISIGLGMILTYDHAYRTNAWSKLNGLFK